jgi:hypothetical protein
MSRVWQRMRGGPAEDRQTRWWDERRGAASGYGYPDGERPEAEPGIRIPPQSGVRPVRRRAETEAAPSPTLVPAARRPALPAGPGGVGSGASTPSWADPGEVDERVIYRRPDAVPLRPGGARPVHAELVDGVPVYRIYRPRSTPAAYSPSGGPRRAD